MANEEHFSLDGRCAQCAGCFIPHKGCRTSGTLVLTEEQAKEWRKVSVTQQKRHVISNTPAGEE